MKSNKKMKLLTITAILTALTTIMTAYICHIPVPITGGYIHLGDSIIFLAACILPLPYAMIAGAVGAGLADLLMAPMWVIPTIIVKSLMVIPFFYKGKKIISLRNIIAMIISIVIMIVGYYIAESMVFGSEIAFIKSAMINGIQGVGSAVVFVLLGLTLDRVKIESKL